MAGVPCSKTKRAPTIHPISQERSYTVQYNQLKHLLVTGTASDGSETVTVPEWLFRNLLMASLRSKAHFDEAFYLSSNADIRSALKRGEITSAEEHYYITGYFESRLPKRFSVDERYYIDQNPDIAEAMRRGIVKNAQQHFDSVGFQEGRVPHKDFSLF